MTTVTTYLCVDGASDALDFYRRAFGAVELYRLAMPDGRLGHAEMRIGDTTMMLSDEWPEGGVLGPVSRGGATASLTVTVDDVDALDAMWASALTAGATVEREPADQFYGHRTGTLIDPFGHRWSINAVIEDVSPEEMQRRLQATEQAAG
jgi:PhnB protein